MRFRPGEGPSRGLLCDCEIFGYLPIITFVSSSILETQHRCGDIITILLTVDIFCCEVVTVLFTALSSATRSAALHTSLKADKIRGARKILDEGGTEGFCFKEQRFTHGFIRFHRIFVNKSMKSSLKIC